MIQAMERVTQSYQISALWYALDTIPRKQSARKPPSASPSPLPEGGSDREYPFDRFAELMAHGIARILFSAAELKQTTDSLLSESSAFHKRTINPDRTGLADAVVQYGARFQVYELRTYQIAEAQRSCSFMFARSEPFPLAGAYGEFELTSSGGRHRIAVAYGMSDTNEQALNKVRSAVNRLEAGVTARLTLGGDPGTVRLELTANQTGSAHAFRLSDVLGDTVDITGIGSTTVSAENAVYRVNGGSVISSSVNQVQLDEGRIIVTLKQASPDLVHITVESDRETMQSDLAELVSRFNALRTALDEANGWLNPFIRTKLLSGLPFVNLVIAGIHLQEDGMLQLNEAELADRLNGQFEEVKRSFTGDDGFAAALGQAAERLQTMPADRLLNRLYNGFQFMTQYSAAGIYGYNYGPGNPAIRSYWPMPIAGYLLNDYL